MPTPTRRPAAELPPLPLGEWEDTKTTLHLYLQIVGKVRLARMPPRNHWWHVPLYVASRGLTTRAVPYGGGAETFQVDLDLLDHRAVVTTSEGARRSFTLGLPVAEFHRELFAALGELGIEASIRPEPFDLPFSTPFSEDREHRAWDPAAVERFWRALVWIGAVFEEFAGRFVGKATPVHLFWHSFDLAYSRFSGRPAPGMEGAGAVAREAYSHEVASFGFWAGDAAVREATFYSYVWPLPETLSERPLRPDAARWVGEGGSLQARMPYEAVRESADPRGTLLDFLESAYEAESEAGGWPAEELRRGG